MNIGPKTRTLAPGETVDNLFAGEVHEFLRQNAMVWLAVNGDLNGEDVTFNFISGVDSVVSGARAAENDRSPVWPDDFIISDAAVQGDRMVLQVRNTDAVNPRLIRYALKIEPV
jgi:hypothetical protein